MSLFLPHFYVNNINQNYQMYDFETKTKSQTYDSPHFLNNINQSYQRHDCEIKTISQKYDSAHF